jgi:hypothetical protein
MEGGWKATCVPASELLLWKEGASAWTGARTGGGAGAGMKVGATGVSVAGAWTVGRVDANTEVGAVGGALAAGW